ncbi:type II secretion system F family protein [Mycobacterium sp. pUA109]|uniref:type II secretion system F family protein n=1 Tax=Mycobacterium sp. pUA109 TaxID=3238982 RepID=UPI00351B996E
MSSTAAVLLALALWTGPASPRARAGRYTGAPRPQRPHAAADPLALASSLDLLAVCLAAGMAVSAAAAATAPAAPPRLARVLQRAAALLAVGADPGVAWSTPPGTAEADDPHTEALLGLARRSARSGAALADGVADLAAQCRHDASQSAVAAAERAGVLIAGPLGLCFLPAFVCVGIVPTVAGLAGRVLQAGLL